MQPGYFSSRIYKELVMPFYKKAKPTIPAASSVQAPETGEEIMQRRAKQLLSTLQQYYARDYARLLAQVESGDMARARLTLRALSGTIIDEAYIDPILQVLQTQGAAAQFSRQEALEENPDALRMFLRAGNRQEAIELYQQRTGVDWQTALDAIKDLEQKLAQEEKR
jgi:hypothetical protein